MTPKGILFDFNGTLFFDTALHLEAFRRAFRFYGKTAPSDADMIKNLFGKQNQQICRETFNPNATPAQTAEFAERKESVYLELCDERPECLRLTEGAEELLDTLQKKRNPLCDGNRLRSEKHSLFHGTSKAGSLVLLGKYGL